jgi:hypothetical protein
MDILAKAPERQSRKPLMPWRLAGSPISHNLRSEKRSHERKTVPSGASLGPETADEEIVRKTGRLPVGRTQRVQPAPQVLQNQCEGGKFLESARAD